VLNQFDGSFEGMAIVIVDPMAFLIAIGKATIAFALNLNGDGERKRLSGFANTRSCVFGHVKNFVSALSITNDLAWGVSLPPFAKAQNPRRTGSSIFKRSKVTLP
jgi:hypothetical protein